MANKQQRYIPVGKELVPVSEEAYLYHTRWIANERYRARRDHRCGCTDYRKCTGDCGLCKYQIPGDVLYTDAKVDTDCDHTQDGDIPFAIVLCGDILLSHYGILTFKGGWNLFYLMEIRAICLLLFIVLEKFAFRMRPAHSI